MKFWETFIELCKREGKSPNAVAKELGVASGSVTWWKKGKTPQKATLEKIANHFGVSADYLLGYDLGEREQKMLELFARVPEEKQEHILQLLKIAIKGIE